MHLYTCICVVWQCVCVYVCLFVPTNMCIFMFVCVYMYMHVYVSHVCMCVYIFHYLIICPAYKHIKNILKIAISNNRDVKCMKLIYKIPGPFSSSPSSAPYTKEPPFFNSSAFNLRI